jgi:hypothetical protein
MLSTYYQLANEINVSSLNSVLDAEVGLLEKLAHGEESWVAASPHNADNEAVAATTSATVVSRNCG